MDKFSAILQRGDKIGLIGPNGIGKTTFLKLILGELQPTYGRIRIGSKQEVAYFDQFRSALNENDTVFTRWDRATITLKLVVRKNM